MSARTQVAWFDDEHRVLQALRICRERGLEVEDVISPFPIHGLDDALGLRRTRLGVVTLIGGASGLLLGLVLQYWTSATDWPLNVGGKPFDSLPAFVPVAFETTILGAGLFTVFGLLWRCGLRPWTRGRALGPRATDDGFAIVVTQRDARHEPGRARRVLLECGATCVNDAEDER